MKTRNIVLVLLLIGTSSMNAQETKPKIISGFMNLSGQVSILDGHPAIGPEFKGGMLLFDHVIIGGYANYAFGPASRSFNEIVPGMADRAWKGNFGLMVGYQHQITQRIAFRYLYKGGIGEAEFGTGSLKNFSPVYEVQTWHMTPQVEVKFDLGHRWGITTGIGYQMVIEQHGSGAFRHDLSSPVLSVGLQFGR